MSPVLAPGASTGEGLYLKHVRHSHLHLRAGESVDREYAPSQRHGTFGSPSGWHNKSVYFHELRQGFIPPDSYWTKAQFVSVFSICHH
jgi:hypothetical protein